MISMQERPAHGIDKGRIIGYYPPPNFSMAFIIDNIERFLLTLRDLYHMHLWIRDLFAVETR